ncbi:Protein LATERAL ROOT PRIMORDIUM 1 [Striga hermonthica]|uniref:Protein LATERAL ROOT PRIMORDIUM 1 n=1 Tax=Striga hermonthica TaxID=68872 RepID=A0A9N7RQV8_STRHE|nr:Protein LATERAL ROOT PRIMORDIUM 1 [Striga hermonthica]
MSDGCLGELIKLSAASVLASTRRLQVSESGAFGDWVASSSTSAGDLSLGFNAGPPAANTGGIWPSSSSSSRLPPELFFVSPAPAPAPYHGQETAASTISFDPHPLGIGVIPLLTANPYPLGTNEDGLAAARMHDYLKKATADLHKGPSAAVAPPPGTTSCQDCGNQAKKDCSHGRCRTCCKSRGFNCSTHVKSTWVPAARRRERQLMAVNPTTAAAAGSSQSTSGAPKKPRLAGASQTTTSHTSTSNNNANTPRSFDTSSSHQDAGFKESLPGQVNAPAVFKCVRVTAVDDGGEDEYAYQAVVRIGGHVFKGFLYDQGFDQGKDVLVPNISDLHLGARNGTSSSSHQLVDPTHDLYGGTLIGGSSYGNPIN